MLGEFGAIERRIASNRCMHRFRTLLFWPFVESSILDERLDKRVDEMVKVRNSLSRACLCQY